MALHDGPEDTQLADAQTDIPDALRDYAGRGYVPTAFADARCACGGQLFALAVDDDEGAAERQCTSCQAFASIASSADVAESAELEACACPCGGEHFELTLGLALYADSDDVRWIYVGARCPACRQVGCYADWKCDGSERATDLLARA